MDALYIACAEKAADVMLTIDDKLLKKAIKRYTKGVKNPFNEGVRMSER